jgi:type 1 glutamine amidotransferase
LVTTTLGWHHESVHSGVLAIQQLGVRDNFDVVLVENPGSITDKNLEQFQVIIFVNTTDNIFDSTQQKVRERYIQSGKGFVGIHSASDTETIGPGTTNLSAGCSIFIPLSKLQKSTILDTTLPEYKVSATTIVD